MKARFLVLRNLPGSSTTLTINNMDTIADMIVAIKNAGNAGKESLKLPHSKMKESIARVLKTEGFLKNVEVDLQKGRKVLVVSLFSDKRSPKIKGVKRISKTSKRIYKKSSELKPVKSGYGLLVVTTPQGIMSGKEARKAKIGGEVLFSIW